VVVLITEVLAQPLTPGAYDGLERLFGDLVESCADGEGINR
jgi:hypothetical protein